MISGQVPFPSPSLPEKLYSHQALEPTPLTELVPEVPPALAAVVAKMMRKQPADRYETPEQVVQALEPFLDGAAPTMLEARTTPAMQPPEQTESAVLPPESQTQAKVATDDGAVGRPAEGPPEVDNGQVAPSEEFPVLVDLGPEPPLSASLNRGKPWFGGAGQNAVVGHLGPADVGPHSSPRPGAVGSTAGFFLRRDRLVVLGVPAAILAIAVVVGAGLAPLVQLAVDPALDGGRRCEVEPEDDPEIE